MTDTQILLTACAATVLYTATFMVVFDRVLAWTERKATQPVPDATDTADETATTTPVARTIRRPLRGLAAEPTVLPRTLSGISRPVTVPDDGMQGLIGRLDAVPSSPSAATA